MIAAALTAFLWEWLWIIAAVGAATLLVGSIFVPVYRPWLIAGTIALLPVSGYLKGRADAAENRHVAELKAQVAILEFDLKAAQEAAALGFQQAERQDAEAADLEKKVSEYEAALASRPDGRCTLTDDDVDRLLRIHP